MAALRENATDESALSWSVKIHSDLTHIFAATKVRYPTMAEAWAAAQDLVEEVRGAGYAPAYRIKVGVDSAGWKTGDGSSDGWYGTIETAALPISDA